MICYNSFDPEYRRPLGPAAAGDEVTFRIFADEAVAVSLCSSQPNGEQTLQPMKELGDGWWQLTITAPAEPGLLFYSFQIIAKDARLIRYGNAYDGMGGEGAVYEIGDVSPFQLTVYDPHYKTPSFMHGANIYQIFPDRFCKAPTAAVDDRTDRDMHSEWHERDMMAAVGHEAIYHATNFYGGTLTGITEKLPYLQQLGVTVLYLNPIFKSHSNHHYDTGDYTQVDPLLGTNEEFTTLCEEAEKLGIRVMLDGVFSHTGEDSIYFNRFGTYNSVGAYQSKESPYYDWFKFTEWPEKYSSWWGVMSLPETNEMTPTYTQFMFNPENGIVPSWIRKGACGWRLDVADELPMDFLRQLRKAAKKERHDAVILGEVWEDASNKIAYDERRCYCSGDTLDSVMNYPLRSAILNFMTNQVDAYALKREIDHQAEVYPPQFRYALMNLIGSHDRARVLNELAGKRGDSLSLAQRSKLRLSEKEYEKAVRKYKICLDILCALPGCPTVYYGDEAGVTGAPDPFCRKPFPWGHENLELQEYVAAKLNHHRDSNVLKYGWCEVTCPDADTLVIRRWLDGHDALGRKAAAHQEEIFTISRK